MVICNVSFQNALYLNLFFDTAHVDSEYILSDNLTNDFLYSGVIGIDLVTYYL